jgi:hypothetical protein
LSSSGNESPSSADLITSSVRIIAILGP